MATTKDGCGHPTDWNLRVVMNGQVFTYCVGCIVERCQLDNLEAYDNPYIKLDKQVTEEPEIVKSPVEEIDEKSNPLVDKDIQTKG